MKPLYEYIFSYKILKMDIDESDIEKYVDREALLNLLVPDVVVRESFNVKSIAYLLLKYIISINIDISEKSITVGLQKIIKSPFYVKLKYNNKIIYIDIYINDKLSLHYEIKK